MVDIEEVWARIVEHEGEEFPMKRGAILTYEIQGNVFFPSHTDYPIPIPKSNFEKMLELVPFDGPGVVNQSIRGSSYIWVVLHDPRIRLQDY